MGDYDPFVHYSKANNVVPLSLTKLIRVLYIFYKNYSSFKRT